tara:strand:+ start:10393 stop:11466 length:1074 start_codon:yes stop_codon:yes gene_type:complete
MTLNIFPEHNKKEKKVQIELDEYTEYASKYFDYEFDGVSVFEAWGKPNVPKKFSIGLIVGPSGSGKSTLLDDFGKEENIEWQNKKAIVSHFESPEIAIKKLSAVGLNTIPSWFRPYQVLSNGEKFRADLARRLKNNAVIDEFTSVVDRNVAKAASRSVKRYITKENLSNVVIATCHRDIIEWLEPDWVFDTSDGSYLDGRYLRPTINVKVYPGKTSLWKLFAPHHYLNADLNLSAQCYLAFWKDTLIGFVGVLTQPSGTFQNGWRESRLVILPDYQGLGIGPRLSDAIASLYVSKGRKYFSRTTHERLGAYRDRSSNWKKTSSYGKVVSPMKGYKKHWKVDTRVCYSHEYIGTGLSI